MARLTISSAASTDILTTAEAKTHLRVTHSAEDTYIGTLIKVATTFAEKYCASAFVDTTYKMTMENWQDVFVSNSTPVGGFYSPYTGLSQILLPKSPISSVSSITYYDTDNAQQTWASSNYNVLNPENQKGFIEVADGSEYPSIYSRGNAITITFISGYGAAASDVPDTIKQAVLLIIGNLYEKREDMVHRMPTSAEYLLEPFRIWEY